MGEQVDDRIRQIVDERSEAVRCGKFGPIDLSRVLAELVCLCCRGLSPGFCPRLCGSV